MQDVYFQESCTVPSTHGRHFLILSPQGGLSKWNRPVSRREAGSGIAALFSLVVNKAVKKAPVLGWKAETISREPFTPTCLGWHLALGIGRCHLCIFGCSNHHLQWTQKTHSHFVVLSAAGSSQVVETDTSPWCSGSAAWAPALPL